MIFKNFMILLQEKGLAYMSFIERVRETDAIFRCYVG